MEMQNLIDDQTKVKSVSKKNEGCNDSNGETADQTINSRYVSRENTIVKNLYVANERRQTHFSNSTQYFDHRDDFEDGHTYDEIGSNLIPSNKPSKQIRNVVAILLFLLPVTALLSALLTFIVIQFNNKNNVIYETPNTTTISCIPNETIVERTDIFFNRIPSECPKNWITSRTACYKENTDTKTWQQARDACRVIGADLVSVHYQSETSFLLETFPQSAYWIGLNDIDSEGTFEWSDISGFDYNNWRPMEPNNYRGIEHCVAMYTYDAFQGTWNDNNCFDFFPYICKQVRATNCGQGLWFVFNGSCYMFKPSADNEGIYSWNDSRHACQSYGADLVSIQSKHEYNFLRSMLYESYASILWIGFKDFTSTAKFQWINNEENHYTAWQFGYPNNKDNRCVGITRGTNGNWVNKACTDKNGYICEKHQ